MITALLIALILLSVGLFFVVWCWGMWKAFTEGDDILARSGRALLRRAGLR